MKLDELIQAVPECRVKGRTDLDITGISLDSRTVRRGFLFAALPGALRDGNDFLDEAKQRGAAAILSQKDVSNGGRATRLLAPDARSALARLSDRFFGAPSGEIDVIGITGTNGKTTTAYLVREMLKKAGRKPALLGTIEYMIGERAIPAERTTPEAPLLQALLRESAREGCDSMVMEVSSHALAQKRVECVEFDVAVFTNLGRDHLDFHGSRDVYFNAKASLFCFPSLSHAVINRDDPCGETIAAMASAPVCFFGLGEGAEFRAAGMRREGGGSAGRIFFGGDGYEWSLPLPGMHNVYNALAAAAAGRCCGIPDGAILQSLGSAGPVPGRMDEIKTGRPYRVFIDYAHTEDALENALLAARGEGAGKLIVVFGCGGNRDSSKRVPMGRAAARLADIGIVTSDNPRSEDPLSIIKEISMGFAAAHKSCLRIPDRREAIGAALARAREGDVILIAGKGHERTQEFGDTVIPFNDRDVVVEMIGEGGR